MSNQTSGGPAGTNPVRIGVGRFGRPSGNAIVTLAGRLVGAGLLAAMSGIHLHLYNSGYRGIATIGPLFLLNGVLGVLAAIAVLVSPRRWLGWLSLAGAALQAGTLLALILSLTVGLFNFTESTRAPLLWTTIAVESAGALVLLVIAVRELWPRLRARTARHRAG